MATALTQTTLSAAISASQTTIPVVSASGISAPSNNVSQKLYIIGPGQARGELMTVTSVSGTQVGVSRLDEYKAPWPSGSLVVIGILSNLFESFQTFDPPGAAASNNSSAASAVQVTPWINITTGMQWIWSTVVNCWVPGWQNPGPASVSDAVASVAGATVPSGPLFHMTGNNAITSFTVPIGFTHGSFTAIPDHAAASFTWTAAGGAGSIAVAGTAIQYRAVTFTYDPATTFWYPSYV